MGVHSGESQLPWMSSLRAEYSGRAEEAPSFLGTGELWG